MFDYTCPHCQNVLKVPKRFAGQTGSCKKCGQPITLPTDDSPLAVVTAITDLQPRPQQESTLGEAMLSARALREKYGIPSQWMADLGRPDAVEIMDGDGEMHLYREGRIIAYLDSHLEQYLELMREKEKGMASRVTLSMGDRAKRARETKRWTRVVAIELKPMPPEVIQAARQLLTNNSGGADMDNHPIMLQIRHDYTNYGALLLDLLDGFNRREAVVLLRRRVREMIGASIGLPQQPMTANGV